jgi:hypothetical protein
MHDSFTVHVSKRLSLRIYSDTKPNNLKIADLQKGLVFIYDGIERLAEGTGFGFPIVMTSNETYFSGTAYLETQKQKSTIRIRKIFVMDHVTRNKIRNATLENTRVRTLFNSMARAYQKHRHLRFTTLTLKAIPSRMGVQTAFVKATPIGKAIVTYRISKECVKVKAEFKLPKTEIKNLFILNEQGTGFFNKYEDSNGTCLFNNQIGAWDQVEADWATLRNANNGVGFQVKNQPNSILRRGREIQTKTLDWVGLDYEIDKRATFFEYEIKILGAS